MAEKEVKKNVTADKKRKLDGEITAENSCQIILYI